MTLVTLRRIRMSASKRRPPDRGSCARYLRPGGVQPVQGDLAHFSLARLHVRAQEAARLLVTPPNHGAKDLGVLVVRLVDAMRLGEIEPPDHPYALRHLAVAARDLGVAGRLDEYAVKRLVERRHFLGRRLA